MDSTCAYQSLLGMSSRLGLTCWIAAAALCRLLLFGVGLGVATTASGTTATATTVVGTALPAAAEGAPASAPAGAPAALAAFLAFLPLPAPSSAAVASVLALAGVALPPPGATPSFGAAAPFLPLGVAPPALPPFPFAGFSAVAAPCFFGFLP